MSRKVPQEQVNIRIDSTLYEVLEAAAFVHRSSVTELAREAVQGLARTYSTQGSVQTILQTRQEEEANLDRGLKEAELVEPQSPPDRQSSD